MVVVVVIVMLGVALPESVWSNFALVMVVVVVMVMLGVALPE